MFLIIHKFYHLILNTIIKVFFLFLSTTNKMQRYTVFFVVVSAVHVLSSFSAHHQELAVAANKSDKYPMLYVQFLSS